MSRKLSFLIIILVVVTLLSGCSPPPAQLPTLAATIALPTATSTATVEPSPTIFPSPTATSTPAATPTPVPAVLVGAGDVAYCGEAPEYQGDEQTAAIIKQILEQNPQAQVFIAGDVVYGEGTAAEYRSCFNPSWGSFKDQIHPSPGNHDYMTDNGTPYYNYFGAAAGPPGLGYYSYDLGTWHIVVLNSNCNEISCASNSRQVEWLRQDLQEHSQGCTLAYWHHPRFSSGIAGGTGAVNAFWKTAVEMGVDVIVNGHDHDYERFAPMDADGNADPNGVREFVVGTGGAVLRDFGEIKPNSEVRYNASHGVIQFLLYPGSYSWQYLPTGDAANADSGSGECH